METKAIVLAYETLPEAMTKKQMVMSVIDNWLETYRTQVLLHKDYAKNFKITNEESRKTATNYREEMRNAARDIDAKRRDIFIQVKRDIKEMELPMNNVVDELEKLQKIYDAEIGRDFMEQRRIKEEAEARLRAEAEKQRLQAQEAMIAAALAKDDESLLDEADSVFIPEITLAAPERTTKTESGSTNVRMDIEVVLDDKQKLIAHIASGKDPKIPNMFLAVDLAYAKKWVKMMNVKGNEIPGLIIKEVPVVSGRTK